MRFIWDKTIVILGILPMALFGFSLPAMAEQEVHISNEPSYMTEQERTEWEQSLGARKQELDTEETVVQEAVAEETEEVTPPVDVARQDTKVELKAEPEKDPIKTCQVTIDDSLKTTPIEFLPGRFTLPRTAHENLQNLADILNECQTANVIIEGHTDASGQPQANQRLSGQRASSVLGLLIQFGVDKKRLRAVGYGADKPIVDNDTIENRALNRRIEMKLY